MSLWIALRDDEAGYIVTAELVLVSTMLVVGLVAGYASLRDAVVGETGDVAHAIDSLNQSYHYVGFSSPKPGGIKSAFVGSRFVDTDDGGIDIAASSGTRAEPRVRSGVIESRTESGVIIAPQPAPQPEVIVEEQETVIESEGEVIIGGPGFVPGAGPQFTPGPVMPTPSETIIEPGPAPTPLPSQSVGPGVAIDCPTDGACTPGTETMGESFAELPLHGPVVPATGYRHPSQFYGGPSAPARVHFGFARPQTYPYGVNRSEVRTGTTYGNNLPFGSGGTAFNGSTTIFRGGDSVGVNVWQPGLGYGDGYGVRTGLGLRPGRKSVIGLPGPRPRSNRCGNCP